MKIQKFTVNIFFIIVLLFIFKYNKINHNIPVQEIEKNLKNKQKYLIFQNFKLILVFRISKNSYKTNLRLIQ